MERLVGALLVHDVCVWEVGVEARDRLSFSVRTHG